MAVNPRSSVEHDTEWQRTGPRRRDPPIVLETATATPGCRGRAHEQRRHGGRRRQTTTLVVHRWAVALEIERSDRPSESRFIGRRIDVDSTARRSTRGRRSVRHEPVTPIAPSRQDRSVDGCLVRAEPAGIAGRTPGCRRSRGPAIRGRGRPRRPSQAVTAARTDHAPTISTTPATWTAQALAEQEDRRRRRRSPRTGCP